MRTLQALGLGLGVAVTCLWGQLSVAPGPPVVSEPCAPAITVAGHLVCGEPGLAAVRALCGRSTARSGDVVALAGDCDHRRMPGEELLALGVAIDINSAGLAELESLPGIGPTLARRIAVLRPFARVDDLRRVPGIGPVRLAGLRPHVAANFPGDPLKPP
jgi:hypothetical protein